MAEKKTKTGLGKIQKLIVDGSKELVKGIVLKRVLVLSIVFAISAGLSATSFAQTPYEVFENSIGSVLKAVSEGNIALAKNDIESAKKYLSEAEGYLATASEAFKKLTAEERGEVQGDLDNAQKEVDDLRAAIEAAAAAPPPAPPPAPVSGQIVFPSGGGITLPYAMGSFGGSIIIPPTSPGLKDIKGQPVTGVSSSGAVTGYWGAGYWLWGVAEGAIGSWLPLTIERVGTQINLSTPGYENQNIRLWYKTGDGTGQYDNVMANWQEAQDGVDGFSFNSSTATWMHDNQIGQGSPEVYYKAFLSQPNPDFFATMEAVGKINYDVGPNYILFTQLLKPQSGDLETWGLQDLFGDQIADGDIQYAAPGLLRAACVSGTWDPASVKISEGFWIKSSISKTITLMGSVLNQDFEKTIAAGYDLYGYPYPRTIDVTLGSSTDLGIDPPIEGDEVQLLVGGGLLRYVHGASGWDADFSVGMGKGYWYSNPSSATRYFRVNLP